MNRKIIGMLAMSSFVFGMEDGAPMKHVQSGVSIESRGAETEKLAALDALVSGAKPVVTKKAGLFSAGEVAQPKAVSAPIAKPTVGSSVKVMVEVKPETLGATRHLESDDDDKAAPGCCAARPKSPSKSPSSKSR